MSRQGADVQIALCLGQGYRRRHSASDLSHSQSRWAHDPELPHSPWSTALTSNIKTNVKHQNIDITICLCVKHQIHMLNIKYPNKPQTSMVKSTLNIKTRV